MTGNVGREIERMAETRFELRMLWFHCSMVRLLHSSLTLCFAMKSYVRILLYHFLCESQLYLPNLPPTINTGTHLAVWGRTFHPFYLDQSTNLYHINILDRPALNPPCTNTPRA